jgi:hypothetical protein
LALTHLLQGFPDGLGKTHTGLSLN